MRGRAIRICDDRYNETWFRLLDVATLSIVNLTGSVCIAKMGKPLTYPLIANNEATQLIHAYLIGAIDEFGNLIRPDILTNAPEVQGGSDANAGRN